MVHQLRRHEKKKDCIAYGITADATSFFFLTIDEKSRVSLSPSSHQPTKKT